MFFFVTFLLKFSDINRSTLNSNSYKHYLRIFSHQLHHRNPKHSCIAYARRYTFPPLDRKTCQFLHKLVLYEDNDNVKRSHKYVLLVYLYRCPGHIRFYHFRAKFSCQDSFQIKRSKLSYSQ